MKNTPQQIEELVVVTQHAVDRLREHKPHAERSDVRHAWYKAVSVSPEYAAAITARVRVDFDTHYRITHNGRGMFVAVDDPTVIGQVRIKTYLRFCSRQRRIWRFGETYPRLTALRN